LSASLEVCGLSKRFGDFTAVDGLDLELRSGQIFGLLGPNAAGKTTTIRMLAGILEATGGEARILGLDLRRERDAIKQRIGYVAQHFGLYPELTVQENLAFYGGLYGRIPAARQGELLDRYGLTPFVARRAGQLSGGYRRRLSIACAVSHDPELIFLDEPTAGIDPSTRKELWDLFYDLATAGKTLFVTTHYMEEAERCHRLAFLSRGRKVADGTPMQIREQLGDMTVYALELDHDPDLVAALGRLDGVRVVNRFGRTLRLVVDERLDRDRLTGFLRDHHDGIPAPVSVAPTLEDVFIAVTENAS